MLSSCSSSSSALLSVCFLASNAVLQHPQQRAAWLLIALLSSAGMQSFSTSICI